VIIQPSFDHCLRKWDEGTLFIGIALNSLMKCRKGNRPLVIAFGDKPAGETGGYSQYVRFHFDKEVLIASSILPGPYNIDIQISHAGHLLI
jgi:hypothetical protein